jgi:hypothetical protein
MYSMPNALQSPLLVRIHVRHLASFAVHNAPRREPEPTKPTKVLTKGGDLRGAQVDVP